MLLELVAVLLEQKGYRVLGAANGEKAVEVYSRHQHEIALVITDLGLPKLDGWEVFKRVRSVNPKGRVPGERLCGPGPRLKRDRVESPAT